MATTPALPQPQTPRYTGTTPYGFPDPNNALLKPSGPEYQLALSEGTYVLRDEVILGTIPLHPSDTSNLPHHILDPKIGPPTAGVQLSLAVIAPRKTSPRLRRIPTKNSAKSSVPPSISEHLQESSASSSEASSVNVLSQFTSNNFKGLFGGNHNAPPSEAPSKDSKDTKDTSANVKRKKPKNNLAKSGSSFISRMIPHDHLNKRLQERDQDGLLAFVNHSRAFMWLDMSAPNKQEALTRILFTRANALCHDFNPETRSPTHLDIAIGFNSADIMWYEPMSSKYARINKNGVMNASPVSSIRWVPGSENLFLTGHFDGTIMLIDKERDDAAFTPDQDQVSPHELTAKTADGKHIPRMAVRKSMHSKSQKNNPVAFWRVSKQRIHQMTFSPDGKGLTIASEDGSLRVVDFLSETLLKQFPSYYGGLTCLAWSPDGQYVLTGGQDDMLHIWSSEDHMLVARCEGHKSWVTYAAFDPWRCDGRSYRFASVGEDCRLIFWDFSVSMLPRARAASIARQSVSSAPSRPASRTHSATSLTQVIASRLKLSPDLSNGVNVESIDADNSPYQPVVPRSARPILPPVFSKEIDHHALSWVGFEEDCVITACAKGHIRTWDRPREETGPDGSPLPGFSDPFRP